MNSIGAHQSPIRADKTRPDHSHRFSSVAKQRIMPLSYRRIIGGGTRRDEDRFIAKTLERFGTDTHAIPIGRARIGIYLLTRFAVRGERRKVLMSPFTIPDIVTMVTLAGGEPVFFDFEPDSTTCDLNHFESLIDNDTACAFVTHQHVNEPRLEEIARICRTRGAYFFDDCAMAFGGLIGERPIGTLTDASVFSFSSFKLLNFFWGGIVTSRNPEIARFLADAVENWPRLTARDYLVPARECLKYDFASRPPLFNALVFPMFQKRIRSSGAPRSLENVRIETTSLNLSLTSRPSFAAFAEWSGKLGKIDGWLAHRRVIAQVYLRLLGEHMVSSRTAEPVLDGSCFMNFPVVVPEARCDDICRGMMLSGFDVGRNLYPNVHRHPKFTTVAGASDNVDRLTRSTIYLPTHQGVSEAYAEAIAGQLAELHLRNYNYGDMVRSYGDYNYGDMIT